MAIHGRLKQIRAESDGAYNACRGGCITPRQRVLHSETLPPDLVDQVLEIAAHEDVMVYMMSSGQALANKSQVADTAGQ